MFFFNAAGQHIWSVDGSCSRMLKEPLYAREPPVYDPSLWVSVFDFKMPIHTPFDGLIDIYLFI